MLYRRMLYRWFGLLLLWGAMLFTVMQEDTLIWVVSAICSITAMHFISKWVKVGGLPQLGLQMQSGWLRYLLLGCFIGTGYQLIRFAMMNGTGIFTLQPVSADLNSLIISTVILLVSTAYIGFAEEIVFRGYLMNILPSSLSSKTVAVISASLFTLAHLIDGNLDLFRISFLFLVGLLLAACYMKTRSLWFVAGIHWFWDFSWFYLGADGGASSSKLVNVTLNQELSFYYSLIDVLMAAGILVLVIFIARRISSKKISRQHADDHRASDR